MNDLEQFKRVAVHAKHLLMHACTHATSMQPVQRMIAVHDMHNAVEWLLGGLWQFHYGASEEKPWTMMNLFDRVSKDRKQTLILRREISMLNEARNQAQHHAIAPSIDALTNYVGFVQAFFRQTLRDVSPECEYDTLFLGLLLSSDLDFWIVSDCFPQRLSTWLSAKVEAIDPPPGYDELDEPWVRYNLNLRKMMLEAEERMLPFSRDGSEARDAARIVLDVLASCLAFGQELARRGLHILGDPTSTQPPDERPMDDEAPHAADVDAIPYALKLVFEHEYLVLSLSDAVNRVRVATMIPFGFEDAERSYPVDWRAREGVSAVVPALETLALGIDQKGMQRFMGSYVRAIAPPAPTIGYSELVWCYDFVLNIMLDLEPLVQSVPLSRRRILLSSVL